MTYADQDAAPAARRRGAETWERVRADYLAGESAPQLCARYDVGLTALRTRARDEGWRRGDAPDPPPQDDEDALDAPALDADELAELAWRRMSAAVVRGRLKEALGWERLHRSLRRTAEAVGRETDRSRARAVEAVTDRANGLAAALAAAAAPGATEAQLQALEALVAEQEAHDPHDPHAVCAPAPPNRAQRRAARAKGRGKP